VQSPTALFGQVHTFDLPERAIHSVGAQGKWTDDELTAESPLHLAQGKRSRSSAHEGVSVVDISKLRQEYVDEPLALDDLKDHPIKQFEGWFQRACNAEIREPNAMVLATVDHDGPAQRTVLLKYYDYQGFVFFTNYGSRKARHIGQNVNVGLLFPWYPLQRQVEINGRAHRVSTAESLKYFATRPRGAQLGAWASPQSSVVKAPGLFQAKLEELKGKFAGSEVPMPSFWGGFRVVPHRFEFWQGRPNRVHDRFQYSRQDDDRWVIERLAP
jgi:pyridoxamine 5'-phosphate oxidase